MEILEKIKEFFRKNNNTKTYLLILNLLLVSFLIIFSNIRILPFNNVGDFWFLVFIVLLLALYRPGWAFLFFIGTIALENINLAPANINLTIRPYQLLGVSIVIALIVRIFSGRLNFKLPRVLWSDWIIAIFVFSGFITSIFSGPTTKLLVVGPLKQAVIIFSFAILYFLVRVFVQSINDLKKIIPFFLSSFLVVALYSIWQNYSFLNNKNHFEIMPGRPNGTFAEADWLGMFLVFLLSALYAISYDFYKKINFDEIKYSIGELSQALLIWLAIILSYTTMILTVSRSAWLGAGVVSVLYLIFCIMHKKHNIIAYVLLSFVFSLSIVFIFNLTNFELGNRAVSTGGKQEITVSCGSEIISPPETIKDTGELERFGCKHINLEEVEMEKSTGRNVYKIYRNDPNVSIRSEIYKKSWKEIKKHLILGIGWGNIGQVLGSDERGENLNSSNIFLEVWLGAGIIGLLSFLLVLGNIFYKGIRELFYNKNNTSINLFIILSFFAILVPNLFNAGIMLGFLWVWLAVAQVDIKKL